MYFQSRNNANLLVFLGLLGAAYGGPVDRGWSKEVVELDGHRFTVPDGFTVEEAVGPPLVKRPITASFDEQGRLYVAESSGSNDPVEQQLEERPHRILRVEDTDGDGRFDQRTVFADRMMFPEGTLWLDGSLYVSAPPEIWKLTDTDGDGRADRREVWFDGKTLTGCANDLHGPYAGPDGWIYWCKGAFAQQTYERPDGEPFVTRAAHIFRWRPDRQGPIEPVMTGGMDNPVDVVFTPGGERIFTTTFMQHPAGGRRDGLIHALYGGVYGKVHDVIADHPRTDPDVLPPLVHLGPAAPCGLARYRGTAFGPDYRNNLFASSFNLRKVTRHALSSDGATFVATNEDFLVSDNMDFHPTDVIEDADGSLLVIDTGGWYKLCCPTSQLWKPDVLGAIYRVRREDAPIINDPRGLDMNWGKATIEQMIDRLDDNRPAVRQRAVRSLGHRGAEAVPSLLRVVQESPSALARRQAVWASCRIDDPKAHEVAHVALEDDDETVCQAALHTMAVRRDGGAMESLFTVLQYGSAQNRRAAAEALGRIGDSSAVLELVRAAREAADDQALHHSITYALIELNAPKATRFGLQSPHASVRRAALIALDQMPGDHLEPSDVIPLLSADDSKLQEVAGWVASRHPEWGKTLTGHLRRRLWSMGEVTAEQRRAIVEQWAQLASSPAIQRVLADVVTDKTSLRASRTAALETMAQARLDRTPELWIEAVVSVLKQNDPERLRSAIRAVQSFAVPEEHVGTIRTPLLRLAQDTEALASLRLDALSALPGGPGSMDAPVFVFLLDQIGREQSANEQTRAADLLANADLNREQQSQLIEHLPEAGPLALPRLLPAFGKITDEALGLKLVEALEQSPARSALQLGNLRDRLKPFGDRVSSRAEPLLQALDTKAEQTKARIEELLPMTEQGDIRRGQAVFNSEKAACRSCHAIGYVGGEIGPDLTRIGQSRSRRDLLEAIVAPSTSFVQSYEPVLIATADGRVFNGMLKSESDDAITLVLNAEETVRIRRDEIEAMKPGNASIMPAGLDQQLTEQEIADLVTFLKEACQ